MGARTGQQFLDGLRAARAEVWIQGERIEDVTTHPATRNAAHSVAHLYDMQHDPALKDAMTYVSPSSGERVGMSFLTPKTQEDLVRRRVAMKHWADYSGGFMGRTPDYLNSSFMAMAAAAPYFAGNDPRHGKHMVRYYEYIREHDLCLTHTLINPQANRSKSVGEQPDPFLPAGIVEENDKGLIIRGARMLATLAPFSDEIAVFPSTVLKAGGPNVERYSFAFSIPCNTPGLRFLCRESFDLGRSHFDHPLGSRFEELDALVVFDDVLVPWERVFLKGDPERCNGAYGATNAVIHMMHQVVTKNVAKTEFLLGLACAIVQTIAVDQFQHVQEKLAEIIMNLETMRACLRAAEADAALDQWGVMTPARLPLDIARNLYPKMYPRMVEILQLLGASGYMVTPSEADFQGAIGGDVRKYLQAAQGDAEERVKIFRLGWEVACSSFGGRQELYERFFFGDPVRMAGALYSLYEKEPYIARIRDFLNRDDTAEEEAARRAISSAPADIT
ncbi:MAG: 4-hydroxyphenylacetate 3-monooxygenase, oxygenase component [Thermomicrobiales bacterium]